MEHKNLYEQGSNFLPNYPYAGFGVRLVAHIIDGVILSFGLGILSFATGVSFKTGYLDVIYSPGSIIALLLIMTYFVYFETSDKQATIGKSIMDLKVIKQDGSKLTTTDAIVRYFSKILSAFLLMIGYLMVLFDDKKRALHDRIANTYVIKA